MWFVTLQYEDEHEIEGIFPSFYYAHKFSREISNDYPRSEANVLHFGHGGCYTYLGGEQISQVHYPQE